MIFLDFFKKNKLHNNMYDINTLSTLNMKICAHIERCRGCLAIEKDQHFGRCPNLSRAGCLLPLPLRHPTLALHPSTHHIKRFLFPLCTSDPEFSEGRTHVFLTFVSLKFG